MIIKILDCTLRDGGYVNNWKFGEESKHKIAEQLIESKIDYVELGYLSNSGLCDNNTTIYSTIPSIKGENKLLLMINCGEFNVEKLTLNKSNYILRYAFHKKDLHKAYEQCKFILEKGYKVFLQPMVITQYNIKEFRNLINIANTLPISGFYIVDSFGSLNLKKLSKLFKIADVKLNSDIILGFHSHNNQLQSFTQAKYLCKQNLKHNLIIDCSCLGMGRGAGNLKTELIAKFLNKNYGKKYSIETVKSVCEKYIKIFRSINFWGFSEIYRYTSKLNCHPNYGLYLLKKNNLNLTEMKNIIRLIPKNSRSIYSEDIINSLFSDFLKKKK